MFVLLLIVLLVVPFVSCKRAEIESVESVLPLPCAIALAQNEEDQDIARLQEKARKAKRPDRMLERLAWMFVEKARVNFDSGYYRLAEQCARCLEARNPRNPEALLVRGHVLHNLHRFKEAEKIARDLISMRENSFDHGLLGDVLMEQGYLEAAAEAYQKMVDLKPSLQSYSRAAHMRWLEGDLNGALVIMRMAAKAGSPRVPEAAAWAYTRLALYELQAGNYKGAQQACRSALSYQKGYPAALLAQGRILLAQGKHAKAIRPLDRAAAANPLPEYLWTLSEALRSAGQMEEARQVEERLDKSGPVSDPRTYALYLATRGEQIDTAVQLTQKELAVRSDVFTFDAHAWALAAAGRLEEALQSIRHASAEGTKDARLFYHAGAIAALAGKKEEARLWWEKANGISQMLLPSERTRLSKDFAAL